MTRVLNFLSRRGSIAIQHPQHPWQSWRDRWIRHLKGTKAPFPLPHNAPPTPPLDVASSTETSKIPATASDTTEDGNQSFLDDDAEALMVNGDGILNIHPDNTTEAWEAWARKYDVSWNTAVFVFVLHR